MKHSIAIDHAKKLIIYRHSGEVGAEAIGKAWEEFMNIPAFTQQKYNLFSDYRNSIFNFEVSDVDKIVDHLYLLKDIIKDKKQALLIDKPISTALSMLFEEKVKERVGFDVKVFSTEKAAYDWLSD